LNKLSYHSIFGSKLLPTSPPSTLFRRDKNRKLMMEKANELRNTRS